MLGNRQMTSRFSTKPLYIQVRDVLAECIATGEWKPSAAIPNEGDLAREFGVSSGTMRKALDLLEEEKLLTRRQGRGTFVNDQSLGDLAVRYSNIRTPAGDHVASEVKYLEVLEAPVTETECARLRIRMHDRVIRARRVRFSEGKPYMLEHLAMPAALFPGMAEQTSFSARIVVLAQQYGILLGKGQERVTIGSAAEEVAKTLQLAPGTSVLVVDRVVHSLEGRPVEWRVGHCDISGKYYLAEFR